MFLDAAARDKKLGNKARVRSRPVSSQTDILSLQRYICIYLIADFGRETMSVFCIYSECLMVNVMQSLVIPV